MKNKDTKSKRRGGDVSPQEFIDGLNQTLAGMPGFRPIPSIAEIKQRLAAKAVQAKARNERICREAIGAEVRVALGGNEFLRGVIVECELADFGTAKVMLECGAARVRRGPFYLRQLPRGGAR